ncbi:hypothetical protein [Mucilaginibacter jinjuensis]|uniref:Uncharacterized protein n=1 Tax=Mucilaginibacter jinjuensis TaxID=1176721 RepID=A0ABY7T619_9SPHI|nr:hypothetical protein [Mucilaginibacter jinjuensis]WCT11157.1 hypothetical protein PQO05_20670 [Mucilaginibacter jinjuensis]
MKKNLLLLLSFCFSVTTVLAQVTSPPAKSDSAKAIVRICAVNRGKALSVLFVIKSKNGEVRVKGGNVLSNINPQAIKSINVLKDSTATRKYGNEARDGVVEAVIDDDKYPDLYKQIEKEVAKKN